MSRAVDMVGKKFEGCVVLERDGTNKDKKATWKCKCHCGNIFVTTGKSIRLGLVKSCGCLKTKTIIEQGKNNKIHGETKTRLYNIWRGMKKRCYLPSDTSYKWYGAKGTKVCGEWLSSYETFRNWALQTGYEEHLTLDRIKNDKGYCPENCRWTDWTTQERNRSNNVIVTFRGDEMTLSEVAEELGESRALISYRYKNNIDFDNPKKKFCKRIRLKGVSV